ncbi:MAG: hypothetical protein ACE362_20745 [Phaeodactylibacter xiamenensis]|nr:hypothetical protein [Phaeodactylibacter xiamenensis]MCR9053052.1 hypothetical protein [bacterium]
MMAYLKYLFRLVALSCTLLPGFGTDAQNLVPNPGFESYFEHPELSVNGVNATADWFKFEYTTEFFHRTYPPIAGVPFNQRGYQEPFEGNGYAGMIVYPWNVREFLAVQLTEPLEAGQVYTLSFQVSLSEQSGYMTDDFGAMLSRERPEQDSLSKYYYVVKNQEGRVLSDTSGWMEIRGQYLAQGGEQYLLIGNLYDQPRTTFQETAVEDSRFWAYYFVDQVELTRCGETGSMLTQLPPQDTIICDSGNARLEALPDADSYQWVGQDVQQQLQTRMPGQYVVNNFFGCDIIQQTFNVETDGCFCDLIMPSPIRLSNQLAPIPSRNVEDYTLELFTAAGQKVWSGSAANVDQAQLPQAAGAYFWRARLQCFRELDQLPFQRTVSGRIILVD